MDNATSARDAPLDVSAIRAQVSGSVIGDDIRYFPEVDSTNRVARELADGDWGPGTVVVADFQSAGRGRRGRSWQAPSSTCLLLSVILVPPPTVPPMYGVMVASLAVADAIRERLRLPTELKWPNDVLIHGRKVCGVLAELSQRQANRRVIVGLGLNVNIPASTLSLVSDEATSLQAEVHMPLKREDIAVVLFKALDMWYGILTKDPEPVFEAWSSRLGLLGSPVLVRETTGDWTGIAMRVQSDGSLVVADKHGAPRSVYAADVSIRRPEDFTGP